MRSPIQGYSGYVQKEPAERQAGRMGLYLYLLFEEDASLPRFRDSVGRQKGMPEGFVLYYTNQCPFTAKYIPIPGEMAKVRSAAFQTVHTGTREDAQNAHSHFTTFAFFGIFIQPSIPL